MAKRIFAILLSLCMVFCAVLCYAEDPDDDDDWDDEDFEDSGFEESDSTAGFKTVSTYNIQVFSFGDFLYKKTEDETGIMLTSYTGEEEDVVFPSEIENLPVIEISDGMCQSNPVLVSIRIPGTVRIIGNVAFSACPNLTSVVIEEGLYRIGMCCFGGCPELSTVQLPDSLEIVDNFVFARCPALEEVTFGTQLKSIGMQAFLGCASLNKITIPGGDNVSLGDNLFQECPNEVEIAY